MDAASRRKWHRKRRRLKEIEARSRDGQGSSGSTRPPKRGFLARWLRRGSRPAYKPTGAVVVDQSEETDWSWGFDPDFVSSPTKASSSTRIASSSETLSASPSPALDPDLPSTPTRAPYREPASKSSSKRTLKRTRIVRAKASHEKSAASAAHRIDGSHPLRRRGSHRLRRLAVLALLALIFGPVLPVALLRFVPPLTSAMMLQRWWDARVEGRDFDLEYDWVPATKIAPSLRAAVVASEDQRFFEHAGFDWKELRNAVDDWRNGDSLRGASTITQQVAKNLFLWPGRSFARKALEAWLTVWIEWLWPKERILEVYLNIAEMGDGTFGAEAAARRYFKRPAVKLTAHESALIAAMLPSPLRSNPANPSPHLQRRQRWILRQI